MKLFSIKRYLWQRWDSNPRLRRDWCLKPAPQTTRPRYRMHLTLLFRIHLAYPLLGEKVTEKNTYSDCLYKLLGCPWGTPSTVIISVFSRLCRKTITPGREDTRSSTQKRCPHHLSVSYDFPFHEHFLHLLIPPVHRQICPCKIRHYKRQPPKIKASAKIPTQKAQTSSDVLQLYQNYENCLHALLTSVKFVLGFFSFFLSFISKGAFVQHLLYPELCACAVRSFTMCSVGQSCCVLLFKFAF